MDRFITSHENFSIWQLAESGLYDLARFVVLENYKHHQKLSDNAIVNAEEIQEVYNEEMRFFESSKIFVAKNNVGRIIGAIRVMKWNRKDELPITKLFGIRNINEISPENSNAHVWHIGRFAVSSDLGRDSISLFRILMMYVSALICKNEKGIILAECDSKLFRTMRSMGIDVNDLGDGIDYLGSETIPMYATRDGLIKFVMRNFSLALNVDGSESRQENLKMSYRRGKMIA